MAGQVVLQLISMMGALHLRVASIDIHLLLAAG
jgi:hypothetical protein